MSDPVTDDVLNMSDDDFLKLAPAPSDEATTTIPAAEAGSGEEEAQADDDHLETDDGTDTTTTTATTDTAAGADDKSVTTDPAGKDGVAGEAVTEAGTTEAKSAPAVTMTDADYINIGKQIMSEFKANGSSIKVKNVEDAIQLMQMGANYHKKMSGLKPSLKTLKLLENNGLLDPEKLNYLIDLSQKKPEAITQLLKDSKIDPMNVDLTDATSYVPQHRSVSDTEILLDEVLDSISHSPSYNRTLTVLGDEWDTDSRTLLATNPEVIRTINVHIENGIYDQVAKAVEYERSMGKLSGVSDYEAYQRVGTYMHENNMFVSAAKQPANDTTTTVASMNTQVPDAAAVAAEAARIAAKKAASPSRSGKTTDSKVDYNPLSMSDEDFLKINKLHI